MSKSTASSGAKAEQQRLARELAAAKKSLREASANVGRIERRIKRLSDTPDTAAPTPKKRKAKKAARTYPKPTITPEEALSMFDGLVTTYRQEGPEQTKKQLQEWLEKTNSSDRAIVARELHFMLPARPSKQAMFEGLAHRVTQRILLTTNVNVTLSRKEQLASAKSA